MIFLISPCWPPFLYLLLYRSCNLFYELPLSGLLLSWVILFWLSVLSKHSKNILCSLMILTNWAASLDWLLSSFISESLLDWNLQAHHNCLCKSSWQSATRWTIYSNKASFESPAISNTLTDLQMLFVCRTQGCPLHVNSWCWGVV